MASQEIPWESTQLFVINNLNVGADCAGDLNGTAFEDSCGVCSGGNSGHEADSDIDDCGDCFGGNECNELKSKSGAKYTIEEVYTHDTSTCKISKG